MTAGTPALNTPITRSEAEARIEAALKVAQDAQRRFQTVEPDDGLGRHIIGKQAIEAIISILNGGSHGLRV